MSSMFTRSSHGASRRHRGAQWVAIAALCGLVVGCGDSDDDASSSPSASASSAPSTASSSSSATPASTSQSSTAPAASTNTSSEPPAKIGFLWEIKGESPNSISDYDNGAAIAIDAINAAGGVLGKPVETFREPMSISDPQRARASFLKAVDQKPSAFVGPVFNIQPYARDIDQAGIPMIQGSVEAPLALGQDAGSKWMFAIEPYGSAAAKYAVEFAQKELDAKTLGAIATDEASGRSNTDQSVKEAAALDVQIGSPEFVATSATDLTAAVLAMKNTDAVLAWTFPNVLALTVKQLQQNGITSPVIGASTTQIAVAAKLIPEDALDHLYGMVPCGLSVTASRAQSKAFTEEYVKRFGSTPSPKAALTHDAVWLVAEAMNQAGTTTDMEKIRATLETLKWSEGACQPVYQADGTHRLSHQVAAVKFAIDGTAQEVGTYTIPALAAGESLS